MAGPSKGPNKRKYVTTACDTCREGKVKENRPRNETDQNSVMELVLLAQIAYTECGRAIIQLEPTRESICIYQNSSLQRLTDSSVEYLSNWSSIYWSIGSINYINL
ncbi:hypothetical protein N7488_011862 [Penicillium malachiteum]|nr:hypothetical protein N7488_011862 [Penicillium malachiteum]